MASSRVGASRLVDLVTSSERRQFYRNAGFWSSETAADPLAGHAEASPDRAAVIELVGNVSHLWRDLRKMPASRAIIDNRTGTRYGSR
jgi:non-ribosomal peptide synthetase component E (peptide arylation enzyme)